MNTAVFFNMLRGCQDRKIHVLNQGSPSTEPRIDIVYHLVQVHTQIEKTMSHINTVLYIHQSAKSFISAYNHVPLHILK